MLRTLRKLKKFLKYKYSLLAGKYSSEGFENMKFNIYMKYVLGGIFLFLIQAILVVVMTEVIGVKFLFAYAVALVLYIILSFVYHNEFTFKKMVNVKKGTLRKFLFYMGVSSSLTYGFVFLLTNFFLWAYIPAVFLVAVCMSIINFIVNAGWVF